MKLYKVYITEHTEKQVEIEANSGDEALEKAEEMYDNGEIIFFNGFDENSWIDCYIDPHEKPKALSDETHIPL